MKVDLKYLTEERTQHGRVVVYVRLNGKRIRIRARAGTPEFMEDYRAAITALRSGAPAPTAKSAAAMMPRGTLGWLVETYRRESVEYRRMKPTGQKRRAARLATLVDAHGTKPMMMDRANIMAGLAKRADKPGAANEWLKDLKALYTWAMDAGIVLANPAAGIKKIRYAVNSHHPWTLDEIAQYLTRHKDNGRATLACLFLLVTALRRDDATKAGRQHIRAGRLVYQASKNAEVRDVALPPFLVALIDSTAAGGLAILTNNLGNPFPSGAAFGNWFRDRCDEAGLNRCSAHGLRHALATIASENSASTHEIMSLLADRGLEQAQRYTKSAESRRLSDSGMAKALGPIQTMIETVAPKTGVPEGATKTGAK